MNPKRRIDRQGMRWLPIWLGFLLMASPAFGAQSTPPLVESNGDLAWDFQDEKAHWAQYWRALSGKWEPAAEPEHPANRVLRQSYAGRKLAALATKKSYCNFELSVRLRTDTFEHKSRNWQMGIVFRRQDASRYYKLRISAANLALIRMTPPRSDAIPGSEGRTRNAGAGGKGPNEGQLLVFLPLSLERDSWHTLGVKCLGEAITVMFDGRELQTVSDPGVGSGNIGLFASRTPALFDDIRLSYERVPKLAGRMRVEPETFVPFRGRDAAIYYSLGRDAKVIIRVLDPAGRMFNLLTQTEHSTGVNCITWNGQGLAGQNPLPGTYTVELESGGKTIRNRVRVKSAFGGKGEGKP